jgi:hypothetical protein
MDLHRLARRQDDVITRSQALAAGLSARQVEWRLASGRWQRLHDGIYYVHSGAVPWRSRARAALLRTGHGAALSLETALYVWRLSRRPPDQIHVAVPADRHVARVPGIEVQRRRRLVVRDVDGFPVTSAAQTVIDVADRPDSRKDEVVALVARACQLHRVTEAQLVAELAARRTHRFRRLLGLLLIDAAGVESVPEFLFVTKVERPHGLPTFERQVVGHGVRRDFRNRRYGLTVEIDGAVWHAGDRFHTDRQRDRKTARRGDVTLRGTWWDVDDNPCEFAVDVGMTLMQRGWPGPPRGCSPGCRVPTRLSG